jgi:hypothetical protein
MKFKAIKFNRKYAVANAQGYIAEDEIETLKEAKKIAKWINQNN